MSESASEQMKIVASEIYENLQMGLSTLRSHKLRSFLTIIGVVIGVWTVMTIASIISGIDMAVLKEVESFGTRSILITKYDAGARTARMTSEERMRKSLTYDDAIAISKLPAVELAVPFLYITNDYFGEQLRVTADGKTSVAVRMEGTLPDFERAGTRIISDGRFFTQFENNSNQYVCVIGSSVAENFFPHGSAVDEMLKIGGREFRVTGVFEKREQLLGGGSGAADQNNIIYVPFNVARKLRPNSDDIYIMAVARQGMIREARDQVTDLLRVRRQVRFDEPNNFGVATADTFIDQFHSITIGVAIAMVVISSVGLMVSGIGVMNIMLVSVTERTKEIGVRKSLGARRRDILWQFLTEAMMLTGCGGLIGLSVGWATTLLIGIFIPSYVPLWAPVVGFFASVGIGLIFGIWPAWKAQRLNPIDALRYE